MDEKRDGYIYSVDSTRDSLRQSGWHELLEATAKKKNTVRRTAVQNVIQISPNVFCNDPSSKYIMYNVKIIPFKMQYFTKNLLSNVYVSEQPSVSKPNFSYRATPEDVDTNFGL